MKKTIYIILLAIVAVLTTRELKSQEIEQNNLYTRNWFMVNPSMAGDNGMVNMYFNARRQWVGFDGAPRSLAFGVHGPLTDNSGLGVTITGRESGIIKNFRANLNYSHRARINEDQSLVFGVFGGADNQSFNKAAIRNSDLLDPTLESGDYERTNFVAGAGMRYTLGYFELGVVAPQLVQGNSFFNKYFIGTMRLTMHPSEKFTIEPSLLFRVLPDNVSQLDINVWAEYMKKVWLMVAGRTNGSAVFGVGINTAGFGIGYTYEYNSNYLGMVSHGSHEVLFTIAFNRPKNTGK